MEYKPENVRFIEGVNYLIEHNLVSSKAFLAKITGVNTQLIYDIFKNKHKPSSELLEKCQAIYGLSKRYIILGEGNIVIDKSISKDNSVENADQELSYIKLLPVSAQAGSLNDFIVKVKESDCEQIVSPIRGADFAMSVAGDSMAPEYPNGSQILIKKINEKSYIEWGKVYVIDATNGTVIKIVNRSEKEGHILCTSINPDQKRYEPFDLPLSEVIGMYRVMMCMSIK